MSVYDLNFTGEIKIKNMKDEPNDRIICINITEEARALLEETKSINTIRANITNLTDDLGIEVEAEVSKLLQKSHERRCCDSCDHMDWDMEDTEEIWCPIIEKRVPWDFECEEYEGFFKEDD